MMKKKTNNLKTESVAYARKLPTEMILGFLLGTIPFLEYSSTEKEVEDVVSMLLASELLIHHYFALLIPYFLVCAFKYGVRLRSDAAIRIFRFIYKIFAETGANFLTMLRTGLGALIGFYMTALSTDVIELAPHEHARLIGFIIMVLMFSGALSILHDLLAVSGKNIDNRNPITFDNNLR